MIAQVALHIDRVFNIETVERNGVLANRTGERILQQAHLVVVDIHIGKHVLQRRVQNVSRLDEVVDTRRVLALHNLFFGMRVFTVNMLGNGLVNADGQNKLVVQRTYLHLVEQPLLLLEFGVFQIHRFQVVHCQRNLLILSKLVIRMIVERGLLLSGNHTLHQLDRRIILTRVPALALRPDLNVFQGAALRLQPDAQLRTCLSLNLYILTSVTQCRDGQRPSVVTLNLEHACLIGRYHHMVSAVDSAGKRNAVACCRVYHHALNLLCADIQSHHQQSKAYYHYPLFQYHGP